MRYRYYICDVFSSTRFGGNALAVLADAAGLSPRQMQQIAREFNFSETAFVFRSGAPLVRRVRIFTPSAEVPFAGHPNIGTAFVLADTGEFGEIAGRVTVTFEEGAGPVPVTIERRPGGEVWCEVTAPERLSLGPVIATADAAAAVSLEPGDVATATHPPRVASVGLPFVIAELCDRSALERARPRIDRLERFRALGAPPDIFLYVRSGDEYDVRARMFAPLDGVIEDPATGSASCALAAMLAGHDPRPAGSFRWRIAQGVEMGRPSVLYVSAEKRAGSVGAARVGGTCARVAEGWIDAGTEAAQ